MEIALDTEAEGAPSFDQFVQPEVTPLRMDASDEAKEDAGVEIELGGKPTPVRIWGEELQEDKWVGFLFLRSGLFEPG